MTPMNEGCSLTEAIKVIEASTTLTSPFDVTLRLETAMSDVKRNVNKRRVELNEVGEARGAGRNVGLRYIGCIFSYSHLFTSSYIDLTVVIELEIDTHAP